MSTNIALTRSYQTVQRPARPSRSAAVAFGRHRGDKPGNGVEVGDDIRQLLPLGPFDEVGLLLLGGFPGWRRRGMAIALPLTGGAVKTANNKSSCLK